ncbi:hypothetical protein [Streptomyces meridianus]|uniref:LPXTG cell wall anchor domain-containing protein n=1 Tax=Streptomyces meridianus TaxID=2938945 RepID=A0ABT0X7W0_9ACTN|nr:hypothetical protein [Streptomyces meridianus]MCM2577864.1 hypothetical protein [Streptomyces meridianus]
MSARRPLMTAATAGILLCGLWFVPSANANPGDRIQVEQARAQPAGQGAQTVPAGAEATGARTASLAATGSVDTTPYLVGGTTFLGFGAILLAHSVRRSRRAVPQPV